MAENDILEAGQQEQIKDFAAKLLQHIIIIIVTETQRMERTN